MFEIIAGLAAFAIFISCAYRWLWKREKPVLHSMLAAVAIFAMLFVAEDGLMEAARLAAFLIVIVAVGFAIAAVINRGLD